VRAFCSDDCLHGRRPSQPPPPRPTAVPRRRAPALALAGGLGLVALGLGQLVPSGRRLERLAPRVAASLTPATASAMEAAPAAAALALLVPRPSPEERDTWVHPLYGPSRQLPLRNTRRFGAAREGLRPEECVGGHCGVDLGTQRGEPVLAVHDGVVERVVREDDGREGRFVRLRHRSGTVVTAYMHLAEIRADLKPGVAVKAGEPIGTVGDTGVVRSGPHLHFAISVRPSVDGPELYIDPEPLLHLWPLKERG
jgi:murein DD-endopeptidase MepM/ murein hydrolase activator NlpD